MFEEGVVNWEELATGEEGIATVEFEEISIERSGSWKDTTELRLKN